MAWGLVDEDGEYCNEFDVADWIKNKDKKHIFDILDYLFFEIDKFDTKFLEMRSDKLLDKLLSELQKRMDWAEDYPIARRDLQDKEKLWLAAINLINEKGLQKEYNSYCDKEFSK